jgi:hypothetical protein
MSKRYSLLSIIWLAVVLAAAGSLPAQDIPAPPQLPGQHSTIVTSDGSIRDDELADYIKQQAQGKAVSDVKLFFQQCYGGGFLDDIERAMAGTGIPWVAGSAAGGSEPAWTGDAGSFWTDSQTGNVGGAGTVQGGIASGNANDPAAPGNPAADSEPEHPQAASGNGGSGVTWGTSAQCVVFAGNPNYQSINNDTDHVEGAFANQYYGDPSSNVYTSSTGARSTQDLKDMIASACNGLNGGQLVLYFGDHGNTEFDLVEFWDWWTKGMAGGIIRADPTAGWGAGFNLHDGWVSGLNWMSQCPGGVPAPCITIEPTGMPLIGSQWQLLLNGILIPLPDIAPGERIDIPVPWQIILSGENVIHLLPTGAGAELILEYLELSSGPVALREVIFGDANRDGLVDLQDFGILKENFGEPGGWYQADFNGDDLIDLQDFGILKDHFGQGWQQPLLGLSVPEPASIALLLAWLAWGSGRRKRPA